MVWWFAITGCVVGFDQQVTLDEPVHRIVVDVTAGDLEIHGRQGPVVIAGEFGGAGGGPITGEVVDGQLTVSYACNLCGGTLVITAPPETALDLVLGAGDLTVADMSGELVASLIGGVATVEGHGAGPVAVTVDAGALDASFAAPPTSLTSTVATGGIDVTVPAGAYSLDLLAGGQLTVDVAVSDDPTSPHAVELTAPNGPIRVSAGP